MDIGVDPSLHPLDTGHCGGIAIVGEFAVDCIVGHTFPWLCGLRNPTIDKELLCTGEEQNLNDSYAVAIVITIIQCLMKVGDDVKILLNVITVYVGGQNIGEFYIGGR